jgi:hypothetical protein
MADAVTSEKQVDGSRKVVYHLTNISDGTGESAVIKLNLSDLTNIRPGVAASSLVLEEVQYDVQGFDYVRLDFNADTNQVCALLSGTNYLDFRHTGGVHAANTGASGFNGDILLTTGGTATSGDTYDILVTFRKKV